MGLVLAGCGGGAGGSGEGVTTTSTAAEKSGNPWAMPASERPPLFDPCAEIPIEAVREGAGPEAQHDPELSRSDPGGLVTCGWETREILFSVLSTWKSYSDYVADPASILDPEPVRVGGREATRMTERVKDPVYSCHLMFFTEQGTVMVTVDLVSGLRYFRGERPAEACDVVDTMTASILDFVPEGDFR